ncbi:family 20 glycosylhydrolase [Shewanella surugensis]|uniref:beta-N-acetylhexosaminidase n=1 Tax=Shewanella surugensis TaxID=212020 RepID=A0ABT0LDK3_9GAMM|nr:family 20 glycosylhydrolase [Shewanella surugensis]MCL1125211.1 family 20 glycosylhydrolase [Shewanella surugensis]
MFIEDGKGTVSIVNGIALPYNFFNEQLFSAIKKRADIINVNLNGVLPVTITISPNDFTGNLHKSGSYTLSIQNDGIEIKGFDNTGVFYAVQSIFSLVDSQQALSLPQLNIKDAPRFDYRGIMIDVARNFRSKNIIFTTLDQMAAYKMNKLHLHLTDDEGWRLEISGLPELTNVGSNRCFDLNETNCLLPQLGSGPTKNNAGSGFFSREDYIDILKYAKARNIEVIPEIDMPAHSRSAVISMEARFKRLMGEGKTVEANEYRLLDPEDTSNVTTVQFYDKQSFINPCLESSTHFVNKVISEVAAMHTEAGVPLTTWHFGGDEAKNIKLGAGFQDINAENKVNSKGTIDLSAQDIPFSKSPQCKILIDKGIVNSFESLPNYFAEKVSNLVADENIPTFQAWQDGLKHSKNADDFATTNKRVNFWDPLFWGGASSVYEWSNKGYQVIISNPDYLYMDMPYEVDPKERGYYWATRAIDTRKIFTFTPENLPQNAETSVDRDGNSFIGKGEVNAKPFYGLSAQLWSETVRTDKQYEYMIFPRLLAVAERAWHRAEWENDYKEGLEYSQETNLVDKEVLLRDWRRFSNILGQRELAKLEQSGVNYRLPIPGAKIENGKLMMNIQFPGVNLQYSEDGEHWINYSDIQSPNVSAEVFIRARSSRITKVSNRPSK